LPAELVRTYHLMPAQEVRDALRFADNGYARSPLAKGSTRPEGWSDIVQQRNRLIAALEVDTA